MKNVVLLNGLPQVKSGLINVVLDTMPSQVCAKFKGRVRKVSNCNCNYNTHYENMVQNSTRDLTVAPIQKASGKHLYNGMYNVLESDKIDITMPSKKRRRGAKHPLTAVREEIEDYKATNLLKPNTKFMFDLENSYKGIEPIK